MVNIFFWIINYKTLTLLYITNEKLSFPLRVSSVNVTLSIWSNLLKKSLKTSVFAQWIINSQYCKVPLKRFYSWCLNIYGLSRLGFWLASWLLLPTFLVLREPHWQSLFRILASLYQNLLQKLLQLSLLMQLNILNIRHWSYLEGFYKTTFSENFKMFLK